MSSKLSPINCCMLIHLPFTVWQNTTKRAGNVAALAMVKDTAIIVSGAGV